MDQKGHITDQKGLKMYEKRQNGVFGPKIPAFLRNWEVPSCPPQRKIILPKNP